MGFCRIVLVLSLCLFAAGCLKEFRDDESFGVAAAKICTQKDLKGPCSGFDDKNVTEDTVWQAIASSQENCYAFVNGLVASETGTNSVLDIGTTTFSALGTAFTPLSTVHAMTAASTMTSGWKTAIDSDVFAKASIANYAQAIQATYYRELGIYVSDFEDRINKRQPIHYWAELAKVQAIHAQCSLASAQSSITAALQVPPTAPAPAMTDTAVTLSGTPKDAETLDLVAQWTAADGNSLTERAEVSLNARMTIPQIVKGLIDKANLALKVVGISALSGADNASLILRSPKSMDVKWSQGGTSSMKFDFGASQDVGTPSKASSIQQPGQAPASIK